MTSRDGKYFANAMIGRVAAEHFLNKLPSGDLHPDELGERLRALAVADGVSFPRLMGFGQALQKHLERLKTDA